MSRVLLECSDLRRIEALVERAYPEEGCGLLLGREDAGERRIREVCGVENACEGSRHERYDIHPERFLELEKRARDRGLEVVGFFHSHPDRPAQPSRFDRERAWPYYSYVIASVVSGRVEATSSWRLSRDGTAFEREELIVTSSPIPERPS